MDLALQLLFTGIGIGAVYALVALGFVLIFRATNVVNFAQGEFSMVAAYLMVVFAVDLGWPYCNPDPDGTPCASLPRIPPSGGRNGANDDGPPFGRDNLLQQPEMLVDEIEGDEVTDALIELSGVLEITE